MTDTTPRREITRTRLVQAAISEFAARGIDATSVETLCEAAGFSRGAFYSNFSSKDDLCVAIMEHHRDMVMTGLAKAFAEPPPDANVEWATGEGLDKFFTIIAPTEEFRITLMEIRLRAMRASELAEHSERLAADTRPDLIQFMERLSEQFGVRFRLPAEDLLDVFEALYFHLDPRGERGADRLLGAVALAVTDKETHAEQ